MYDTCSLFFCSERKYEQGFSEEKDKEHNAKQYNATTNLEVYYMGEHSVKILAS